MRRIERFLWMAGVTLMIVWGAVRTQGASSARRDVADFDAAFGAATVDTAEWSPSRKRHYQDALSHDPGPALGVLSIERVGMEVAIFEGAGELSLDRGTGHIEGTSPPGARGNVGIAGHRDGFFRALKDVHVGDAIELRTPAGAFDYVVEDLRIVAPEDVSVLEPTAVPSLTLVTCYPFYFVGPAPKRYVVRAVRR